MIQNLMKITWRMHNSYAPTWTGNLEDIQEWGHKIIASVFCTSQNGYQSKSLIIDIQIPSIPLLINLITPKSQFLDSIVHPKFARRLFSSTEWSPIDTWELHGEYPHAMLTMAHRVRGNDKKLLKGELLTILAIMRTHLAVASLESHVIIPVSIILLLSTKNIPN